MQFPTIMFTLFFCGVLAVWWLLPAHAPRARRFVLIGASLLFYAATDVRWLGVLVGVSVLAWAGSHWIESNPNGRRGRGWVVVGLLVGHLAGWKYAQWATQLTNEFFTPLGMTPWPLPEWAYPVGLSFFTFHALAIVLDVWHGRRPPYSLPDTLSQVSFFPCLLAGPVLKSDAIAPRLREPFVWRTTPWLDGVLHIALGMTFKWVLSSRAAEWANPTFSGMSSTTVDVWWGVHAYAAQIFFDFAGYSLMALGVARMLGFVLPDNFTQPYHATSAQEFWRSWHRSLSHFFRDHLYIDALGGKNRGPRWALLAAVATMLISGLWHGASATFLVWGAWHALWLVGERVLPGRTRWPSWLGWIVSLEIVVWGWVWFRAESVDVAVEVFRQAFGGLPLGTMPAPTVLLWSAILITMVAVEGWLLARLRQAARTCDSPAGPRFTAPAVTVMLSVWAWVIITLGPIGVPPFIYNGF